MDFVTGLPSCANPDGGPDLDAILVVIDRYSKMVRYIACSQTIDSPQLARLLWDKVFSLFGTPDGIVSDRGPVFTSHFWSALCFHLYTRQRLSTAFHPQTDGQTERQNQVLEHYLRAYCNTRKDDWPSKLCFAEFTYNTTKHSATKTTPFYAVYHYEPQLPWNPKKPEDGLQREVPAAQKRVELMQEERRKLQKLWEQAQATKEKYYNRNRLDKKFDVLSWVLLSTKNIKFKAGKLAPKYIGPFKVIKRVGSSAYQLDLPSLYSRLHPTFHVSLLEDYVSRSGKDPEGYPDGKLPELAENQDDMEWEVQEIVDHKKDKRMKDRRYLVKWKDWPEDHNTWLPMYPNLKNSFDLVNQYNTRHGLTPEPDDVETDEPPSKRQRTSKNAPVREAGAKGGRRRPGRPSKGRRGPGRPPKQK
jgi:hypothetical protein